MRARVGMLALALGMAGCILPGPHDWSGGLEGDYLGTVTYHVEVNDGSRRETGDLEYTITIRIESGADGIRAYLFGLECDAVPMTPSPEGLELDGDVECEQVYIDSGARSTDRETWNELVVTRDGIAGIALEGELESRSIRPGNADSVRVYDVTFTGARVGGE